MASLMIQSQEKTSRKTQSREKERYFCLSKKRGLVMVMIVLHIRIDRKPLSESLISGELTYRSLVNGRISL